MGGCIVYSATRLLLCICIFISSFSFSPIFKHSKFSSHFCQKLWGLQSRDLVHTWAMGGCIVYTGIRLLLHIYPFISPVFFLSSFQLLKRFHRSFLRSCDAYTVDTWYTHGQWVDVSCITETKCCCLFITLFLNFFFLFNFQTLKYLSRISQELWDLQSRNFGHAWTKDECA